RSIKYGMTCDHLRRIGVVLSDGTLSEFTSLSVQDWRRRAELPTFEGTLYGKVARLIPEISEEIERRYPAIPRRVSGYNFDRLVRGLGPGNGVHRAGLHELIAGSEGTLAIVTEADLNLVPRPRATSLLVPHFSSLAAAFDVLQSCLELQPSAV